MHNYWVNQRVKWWRVKYCITTKWPEERAWAENHLYDGVSGKQMAQDWMAHCAKYNWPEYQIDSYFTKPSRWQPEDIITHSIHGGKYELLHCLEDGQWRMRHAMVCHNGHDLWEDMGNFTDISSYIWVKWEASA